MTRDDVKRAAWAVLIVCALAACTHNSSKLVTTSALPALPEAVANNAVAAVDTASGRYLVSFLGLGAGKTHKDIVNYE